MKHFGIIIAVAAVAVVAVVGWIERDNLRRDILEHRRDLNNISEKVIHMASRGEQYALNEVKTLIARHRHSDPHGERGPQGERGRDAV